MPHPAFQQPLPAAGSDATEWALDTLFGVHKPEAWITAVIDPDKAGDWQGSRYKALANSPMVIDPDAGHYVCIALLVPGEDRKAENVEAVTCAVLDDVGKLGLPNTKLDEDLLELLPEPTFTVETSVGNSQVFFAFDPPASAAAYERFADDLKRSAYGGGIRDGTSLVRYVRLPSGKNPKPGKNKFETRLTQASGEKFSLEELRQAFGLGAGMGMGMGTAGTAGPKGAGAKSAAGDAMPEALLLPEDEALALVKEIMALIPNKGVGREDWIGIAFAIWNASGENEDSYDVFLSWTATRVEKGVDPDKDTKDVWDHRLGTKAGVQTLIKHLGFQQTPAANAMIEKIKQIQARSGGVFEAVPGAVDNSGDNSAGTGTGPKAPPLPTIRLSDELVRPGFEHTKPAVILPGVERGEVTLIAGSPGAMKSLWAVQTAIAIVSGQEKVAGVGRLRLTGSVLLYAHEDTREVILKRYASINKYYGLTPSTFPHEFLLRTERLLGRKGESIVLVKGEVEEIERLVRDEKLAVVVVDTLAAAVLSEETNLEFQQTTNHLRALAQRLRVAVILVHHFRKGASGPRAADAVATLDDVRGGSTLIGATRNVLMIEPPNRNERDQFGFDVKRVRKLQHSKNNNGPLDGDRWFELVTVGIPCRDPEDGSVSDEQQPALVWMVPDTVAALLATMREVLRKLEKRIAAGQRTRWSPRDDGQADLAQTVLGMSTREADRILTEMEERKVIKRVPGKDAETRKRILVVQVINSAPLTLDEEDIENNDENGSAL